MKETYRKVNNCVGATILALAALALTPAAARAESIEADLMDAKTLSAETAIVCTFECQDGTGLVLNPCTDGSLGACCQNGAPACADHGGLENGICEQGRLGLPCVPF